MGWPFLHWRLDLGEHDKVAVHLTAQANVVLLDGPNFEAYRGSRRWRGVGGKAVRSPVVLRPPSRGRWHLAVSHTTGKVRVQVVGPDIWEVGRADVPEQEDAVDVTVRVPRAAFEAVKALAARLRISEAALVFRQIVALWREVARHEGEGGPAPLAAGRRAPQVARDRGGGPEAG